MQISFWALGWRSLWRDVRAGELRLVVLAVTLAVAALTAVGFLADRLQSGLQRDAQQLLGGDAVIASDRPLDPVYAEQAAALGLQTAGTVSFPTMARADMAQGGASKLVALKAVGPGYPLRGRLRTASTLDDALSTPVRDAVQTGIPQAGTVWVEAQLLDALGVAPGQPLLLGNSSLTIAAVLTQEPDKGAAFMNFAPRVMLNAADMPATGLIQPASRVNYRMALAGTPAQAKAFEAWADAYIKGGVEGTVRGVRLESLQGGRPELSQTLDRAGKFLSLVALLSALLSAVAVALAARAFAAAHLDDCAMLRVLGLPQRTIAASYVVEFAWVGVFASALGLLLGYVLHHVFLILLAGLVEARLPAPGWAPVLLGGGMGLTLLFAFGLPPVLQLAQVPPLRVIRRDMGQLRPASVGVLAVGVAGFAALLMAVSSDVKLGLIAVGGFAAAVLVFAGLGWLAIQLLRRSVNEATAPRALVLATRQIAARPAYTVVQISALAVGLLALVLLVLLRTDLINGWRSSTPPDAPNRFVINLMPEQAQPFQKALRDAGVENFDWYPMIRGRLVAVNGRSVSAQDYEDDRARRLVEREFNISNSAALPSNNTITGGQWQAEEVGAISLEEGLAKTLRLKVGDVLRFEVAGAPIDSTITSLRKVDWASMRANFFALYPVSAMPDLPVTYLSAFKAPPVRGFDNALVRQFPNITATDVGSAIAQLQKVLDQVIAAVEFLFVFTLAAGLVVLFAAVSATREDRAREYAIMRAVGAGSALLRQVQRIELAGVGLLAGFLASLVASAVGWALAHYVFDFAWVVSLWVPLAGALAGAALALAAGWWGLREVLNRPVMQTLRQAAT
jgi:putative ABC transport system permease protein